MSGDRHRSTSSKEVKICVCFSAGFNAMQSNGLEYSDYSVVIHPVSFANNRLLSVFFKYVLLLTYYHIFLLLCSEERIIFFYIPVNPWHA